MSDTITVKTVLPTPAAGYQNPVSIDGAEGWLSTALLNENAYGRLIEVENLSAINKVNTNNPPNFGTGSNIKELYIGDSVERIGSLNSITVGGTWHDVFSDSSIEKIYGGNNLKFIAARSFSKCRNLSSVSISSVLSVGQLCFEDTRSLLSVQFPNSKYIGNQLFYGNGVIGGSNPDISYLKYAEFGSLIDSGFNYLFGTGSHGNAYEDPTPTGESGNDEDHVRIKLFCNYTEEQKTCQLSDESVYSTISADPIPNIVNGACLSAAFYYPSTAEHYQVWVPACKYWTFMEHTIWGSQEISSHIKWYGDQSVVPQRYAYEEITLDPNKTYFITNGGAKSIAVNVSSLDTEEPVTMTVYDITEEEAPPEPDPDPEPEPEEQEDLEPDPDPEP